MMLRHLTEHDIGGLTPAERLEQARICHCESCSTFRNTVEALVVQAQEEQEPARVLHNLAVIYGAALGQVAPAGELDRFKVIYQQTVDAMASLGHKMAAFMDAEQRETRQ